MTFTAAVADHNLVGRDGLHDARVLGNNRNAGVDR